MDGGRRSNFGEVVVRPARDRCGAPGWRSGLVGEVSVDDPSEVPRRVPVALGRVDGRGAAAREELRRFDGRDERGLGADSEIGEASNSSADGGSEGGGTEREDGGTERDEGGVDGDENGAGSDALRRPRAG